MDVQQSSLDRFLHQRAPYMLSGAWGLRSLIVQSLIGGACVVAGIGMLIGGWFSHDAGMTAGATGPLIAGATNFIVPAIIRRRLGLRPTTEATMTPEARSFVFGLLRKVSGWGFGWPEGHPMSHLYERRLARRMALFGGQHWWSSALGIAPKSAKDVLDPQTFEIIDGACREYNRVAGILETGRTNPAIVKLSRQVQLAADETLFEVFHLAAAMTQYPESAQSQVQACNDRIKSLNELGDRLDAMQTRQQTLTDRVGYNSTMDSVLDELRMEEMARAELTRPTSATAAQPTEEEQQQA